MEPVNISEAREDDIPAIVNLLNECDQFYGDEITEEVSERAQAIESALFDKDRFAYALLATNEDGQAIGFASYSFLWPAAGSSRSLYLKELYVTRDHRKSGAGRRLMQELFDVAKRENCTRVEWTTDTTNVDAQSFYESLGESTFSGKLFYRHDIVS